MYRFGKLFGWSLQQEVLIWTVIGLCCTAIEVFYPTKEHQEFIFNPKETTCHNKTNINVLEDTQTNLNNLRNITKSTSVIHNEISEADIKEKNSNILFDFYTLRVYFLTYIILMYPVLVEQKDLLATPWMVAFGTRITRPFLLCRLYLWFLVFVYWIWLMDKELERHRGVPLTKIKREPFSGENEEEDQESTRILREQRRKIKGIRSNVAGLSLSDILDYHYRSDSRDAIDLFKFVLCDTQFDTSREKRPLKYFDSEDFESMQGSEFSGDEDSVYKDEKQCNVKGIVDKNNYVQPVRVFDCINNQFSNLLLKLVQIQEGNSPSARNSEIDDLTRFLYNRFQFLDRSRTDSIVSKRGETLSCPKYPKPKYLSEYPDIFSKSTYGRLSIESMDIDFNNRLFRKLSEENISRSINLSDKFIDRLLAEEDILASEKSSGEFNKDASE